MKGNKILIAGLVLAGVGTALFFVLKKSKEKSKKEFILLTFEEKGVNDDEYSNISYALDKMSSEELGVVYEFMVFISNEESAPQSLQNKASRIFDRYYFPK